MRFCGILCHSITHCLVSIDKQVVHGVIHAGFLYHSCVTPLSLPIDAEGIETALLSLSRILITGSWCGDTLYIRV